MVSSSMQHKWKARQDCSVRPSATGSVIMGYRVAVPSLCEHGEGGFLPLRDEGRGEKFHEGSTNAKAVDDTFVEPARSGAARRKFLVPDVVFVAEQAGGGLIGREAARDARGLLAFPTGKVLAMRRGGSA